MAKVSGTCDARFKEVEALFQANLDSGEELGASIVVNIAGKNVVDIWGGHADTDKTRAWEENTITNIWSSSKTVLSLAALVLIDRGLLDPNEKVSKYWPEFGANGKQDIEVRHLLSHTSGVSGWDEKMTLEELYDAPKAAALLAKQAPWWTPGTASGYHSVSMGHLVGEVIKRVTGKPVEQFIRDELAGPLGADFQLGAAEADWHRVADVLPPPPPEDLSIMPAGLADPSSVVSRTLLNPLMDAAVANTPAWRRAVAAAVNGHSNARGLARLLSNISLNGSASDALLKAETVDLIFREQANGVDFVLGQHMRFGIGFALSSKGTAMDWLPGGKVCVWGGWGGSIVVCDVERGITITYVMNRMVDTLYGSGRAADYVQGVYRGLGVDI
ncbi:beta-lactamase [Dothidotthia symphoricarpi CBS 119687]|uniref:Beta-lactamase n=1 Tax=Dothidotthia symphoricarpi CBS 119687 TaxID=1392245 RepID=A0A6A5ZZ11_9PLEO|nr:beta-lactamase [Dothidotthia symphoricarpi CBS 119687]KAF2124526.1 beta-lactamase [Dothidotthia symphoricarpi CBS 119687]